MDEFSVCLTTPICVDMFLFSQWLLGASCQDAAQKLSATLVSDFGELPWSCVMGEVREQYNLFEFLQQYLYVPTSIMSPILSNLPPETACKIVSSYYEFDKPVIREILGKRLSTKLRKDMDEVSEKTNVSLKSCRRQFDNIKNILKSHEDTEGSIKSILQFHFNFSDLLIKNYLPLIFVFVVRFETSKKRLNYLTYDDIIACAEHIIEHWANDGLAEKYREPDEIDRTFLEDLRELKHIVLEREFIELHKGLLLNRVEKKAVTLHFLKSFDSNFRLLYRAIFSLGADLTHSKDFRDFFNDVVEKLIEPIKAEDWSYKELDTFLSDLLSTWGEIKGDYEGVARKLDAVYIRYMTSMRKCLLQMYH